MLKDSYYPDTSPQSLFLVNFWLSLSFRAKQPLPVKVIQIKSQHQEVNGPSVKSPLRLVTRLKLAWEHYTVFVGFLTVQDIDEEIIVLGYMRMHCGFPAGFICSVTDSSCTAGGWQESWQVRKPQTNEILVTVTGSRRSHEDNYQ